MRLASDDERSEIDPEPTFLKAMVDSHSRNLLGCLVVGDHAAVIANVAAIAIHLKNADRSASRYSDGPTQCRRSTDGYVAQNRLTDLCKKPANPRAGPPFIK